MKRLLLGFAALLVSFSLITAGDAEAKRLGGGKSSGMSRDNVTQKAAPAAPAQQAAPAAPAPAPAAPQSAMSKWGGPLAGLAAGLGLGWLLSQGGLGGLGSILMGLLLVVAVVFILRKLFAPKQPPATEATGRFMGMGEPAPAAAAPGGSQPAAFDATPAAGGGGATLQRSIPADFDSEGFLRIAKLNFVRLQAANDAGNINDIREFTTPEMFAEIKLQMSERGTAPQHTEVVSLYAELLDVTSETDRHLASVRFYGVIRESTDSLGEQFDEVWHLSKPNDGSSGWAVAGIQQL